MLVELNSMEMPWTDLKAHAIPEEQRPGRREDLFGSLEIRLFLFLNTQNPLPTASPQHLSLIVEIWFLSLCVADLVGLPIKVPVCPDWPTGEHVTQCAPIVLSLGC